MSSRWNPGQSGAQSRAEGGGGQSSGRGEGSRGQGRSESQTGRVRPDGGTRQQKKEVRLHGGGSNKLLRGLMKLRMQLTRNKPADHETPQYHRFQTNIQKLSTYLTQTLNSSNQSQPQTRTQTHSNSQKNKQIIHLLISAFSHKNLKRFLARINYILIGELFAGLKDFMLQARLDREMDRMMSLLVIGFSQFLEGVVAEAENREREKEREEREEKKKKKKSQKQQNQRRQTQPTQTQQQPQPPQTPTLSPTPPKCPKKSCPGNLQDRRCSKNNHLRVFCKECNWSQHSCPKSTSLFTKFVDRITIRPTGERVDGFPSRMLAGTGVANNVKKCVLEGEYKFMGRMKVVDGGPREIFCGYPIVTGQARDLILKNREQQLCLPLQIRKSSIKGAGLGVFPTIQILKPDTLICSYLGEIGLGSLTPILRESSSSPLKPNDSLFTLGWLHNEILIMAPNVYSNIGRFINYNSPDKCNLKPNLCLLEIDKEKKQYEVAVFLTTTRRVRAGEELFYCYGEDYVTEGEGL